MEPLKTEYNKNGYRFKQVSRIGDVAIYEQVEPETGRIVAYEVFEIMKNAERILNGNVIAARETTPGNEKWGQSGFTVWTIQAANSKQASLLAKIDSRK